MERYVVFVIEPTTDNSNLKSNKSVQLLLTRSKSQNGFFKANNASVFLVVINCRHGLQVHLSTSHSKVSELEIENKFKFCRFFALN